MKPKVPGAVLSRRVFMGATSAAAYTALTQMVTAAEAISFGQLYSKFGVLGLEYSDKIKALNGKPVSMEGFMAPPLKAEANFFVLTEIPMALCPFCSSDADWPDNIVVIYLGGKQTFLPGGTRILVDGTLELGSWTDPDTGFLSRLRIRDARFRQA